MRLIIISAFLTFSLLGCNTSSDPNDIERTKLINAKAKWESEFATIDLDGYVFTSKSSCGCPFTTPVRIGVGKESIDSIVEISTQKVLGKSEYANYRTIDQWYSWIASRLNESPDVLTVEYDSLVGYPRKIVYDGKTQIVDDELTHTNDSLSFIYTLPTHNWQ
jgi:hypothetical protein